MQEAVDILASPGCGRRPGGGRLQGRRPLGTLAQGAGQVPDQEPADGHEKTRERQERLQPWQVADPPRVVKEGRQVRIHAVAHDQQGDERGEHERQHDGATGTAGDQRGFFGPLGEVMLGLGHQRIIGPGDARCQDLSGPFLTPPRTLGYRIGTWLSIPNFSFLTSRSTAPASSPFPASGTCTFI